MIPVEYYLIIASVLVLISVGITRFSENLGIPALILFIGVGMLAGSDGPGGIEFDNAYIAQFVGVVALIFILFAGGLDTSWEEVKPVSAASFSLATIGVVLTAAIVGLLTHYLLGLSLTEGLLIGAIISSTDAAAVFSVLRSKGVSLKNNLKPLLELESGSNDPMAVFLTIGLIELITKPESSILNLVKLFLLQMGIGAAAGFLFGKGINLLLNYVKTSYEGVYSVFLFASAVFIYSITALMQGSGFLAAYIAGIIIGNHKFVQLKAVGKFFDSVAWLSQIIVFLILGLLVFPSQLIKVTGNGLLL
ncbi:MAG: potassium/proton antiporter, partial [Syntrophothermus sp.]